MYIQPLTLNTCEGSISGKMVGRETRRTLWAKLTAKLLSLPQIQHVGYYLGFLAGDKTIWRRNTQPLGTDTGCVTTEEKKTFLRVWPKKFVMNSQHTPA